MSRQTPFTCTTYLWISNEKISFVRIVLFPLNLSHWSPSDTYFFTLYFTPFSFLMPLSSCFQEPSQTSLLFAPWFAFHSYSSSGFLLHILFLYFPDPFPSKLSFFVTFKSSHPHFWFLFSLSPLADVFTLFFPHTFLLSWSLLTLKSTVLSSFILFIFFSIH